MNYSKFFTGAFMLGIGALNVIIGTGYVMDALSSRNFTTVFVDEKYDLPEAEVIRETLAEEVVE